MNAAFRHRHDLFVAGLNELPGFACRGGAGTFYAFVDVRGAMQGLGVRTDEAFTEFLLTEALVAGVAGTGFGAPGHVRFSFACSEALLREALARISSALARHADGVVPVGR